MDVADSTYRRRILVNYEIFRKYHHKAWWSELTTRLDARLEALIGHHKNLRIFKKGRGFKYSAIRINQKGDTLANTFVTFIPDGTGWGSESANSQSQVIFKYDYTCQDSIEHIQELDSISDVRFWEGLDATGVIENEKEFWIHPIRNNEFFKTEIAPFPLVVFPLSDSLMQRQKPKTVIMANWGLYTNTETQESYSYHGEVNKDFEFSKNLIYHKLSGEAVNLRHGKSSLDYYFHEEYGFVEMNYNLYDGDRIFFKMIEVLE